MTFSRALHGVVQPGTLQSNLSPALLAGLDAPLNLTAPAKNATVREGTWQPREIVVSGATLMALSPRRFCIPALDGHSPLGTSDKQRPCLRREETKQGKWRRRFLRAALWPPRPYNDGLHVKVSNPELGHGTCQV